MDSFELNKLIGAFLGVVFIIFSVSLISDAIFHSPAPETPGYAIVVPEDEGAGAGGEAEEPAAESVLPLLASADPSAGENVFKRCQACHTVDQGGPNKVGPNLWDIVERPIADHEGFSYSSALQEFSQGGQVVWDYEHLDHFLLDPKGLVPGTAMSFAGLKNIQDRADVIAYLRTLSGDPAPLPEAAPVGDEGGEDAAPAKDGAQETPADSGGAQAAPAENEAGEQEAAPDAAAEESPAEPDAASDGQAEPEAARDVEATPDAAEDGDAAPAP